MAPGVAHTYNMYAAQYPNQQMYNMYANPYYPPYNPYAVPGQAAFPQGTSGYQGASTTSGYGHHSSMQRYAPYGQAAAATSQPAAGTTAAGSTGYEDATAAAAAAAAGSYNAYKDATGGYSGYQQYGYGYSQYNQGYGQYSGQGR